MLTGRLAIYHPRTEKREMREMNCERLRRTDCHLKMATALKRALPIFDESMRSTCPRAFQKFYGEILVSSCSKITGNFSRLIEQGERMDIIDTLERAGHANAGTMR
jgi:hypothetical protein